MNLYLYLYPYVGSIVYAYCANDYKKTVFNVIWHII